MRWFTWARGQNLLTDARARWAQAVGDHGAAHLFTRLNITERVRQHEHADIVEAPLIRR